MGNQNKIFSHFNWPFRLYIQASVHHHPPLSTTGNRPSNSVLESKLKPEYVSLTYYKWGDFTEEVDVDLLEVVDAAELVELVVDLVVDEHTVVVCCVVLHDLVDGLHVQLVDHLHTVKIDDHSTAGISRSLHFWPSKMSMKFLLAVMSGGRLLCQLGYRILIAKLEWATLIWIFLRMNIY